jgi:uncharacterized coiled-coil protein SlyX
VGATGPRLHVDVAHKLMHEGTYCCFMRALYSKLTGMAEFPVALVGGQPPEGTSGSNDAVSAQCWLQVESMLERLQRLSERIDAREADASQLEKTKEGLDAALAEVRMSMECSRVE